jgi:hypothetical protein
MYLTLHVGILMPRLLLISQQAQLMNININTPSIPHAAFEPTREASCKETPSKETPPLPQSQVTLHDRDPSDAPPASTCVLICTTTSVLISASAASNVSTACQLLSAATGTAASTTCDHFSAATAGQFPSAATA